MKVLMNFMMGDGEDDARGKRIRNAEASDRRTVETKRDISTRTMRRRCEIHIREWHIHTESGRGGYTVLLYNFAISDPYAKP